MGSEAAVSWSFVMLMLAVRLVGVFLVLSVLGAGIYLSGQIVSRLSKLQERSTSDR